MQSMGGQLEKLGEQLERGISVLEDQLKSMRQAFQVVKRKSEKLQCSHRVPDHLAVDNQSRQDASMHASEDEDGAHKPLAATVSELEKGLAASNLPLENNLGILNRVGIKFCADIKQEIVELDPSPEQTERMYISKRSLLQVSNARVTSQEVSFTHAADCRLPHTNNFLREYETLAKEWHDKYSSQDNLEISLVLHWDVRSRDEMIMQQVQATNALKQDMEEKISLFHEHFAIIKTKVSE